MTDEEKLYVLMAQAEDLQKHAVELQNKAQETFSALPLAVEQAVKKYAQRGFQRLYTCSALVPSLPEGYMPG